MELRSDIQAAKDKMGARFGGGRELKALETHLWDGETVDTLCVGKYGPGMSLIVLTSHRLLILFRGFGRSMTEDFPLDKISSVQWSQAMMMGTLAIYASGNKAEATSVVNQDGKAMADRLRAVISGQAKPGYAIPAQSAPAAPIRLPDAGWYADPDGAARQRWWDGQQWTGHYAPAVGV